MTDILNTIAARTAERVKERKERKALAEISSEAGSLCGPEPEYPFEKALKKEGISFICEVKKASPSKGILDDSFPYLKIAGEYEAAGADAISVLTEPDWFLGNDRYLTEIKKSVGVPVLRKDFIVDGYQIYESKLLGADAVLLICALLERAELKEYLDIAHGLGMSALVEAHDEDEVMSALKVGTRIIGVNNRDLKTFNVDVGTSLRLRKLVPEDTLFVSESGIKTPEDIDRLRSCKVNGVLIGETLMKSGDKRKMLEALKGAKDR